MNTQMEKPRRWILFVILTVLSFMLAPLWWWLCAGSARAEYWASGWIKTGTAIIVGAIVMLLAWPVWGRLFYAEPSDNPVGLGLLFCLLCAIGLLLYLIGDIIVAVRRHGEGSSI